jgi:broad specificity phosphatase PhoE
VTTLYPVTTLHLVRHPATTWSGHRYAGTTDVPLSPDGRRAVGGIVARLVERAPRGARVVTSPLRRAAGPAARIAAAGGWPLIVDERWREVDFGAVEGATFDDLADRWPLLADRILHGDRAVDWPDGESAEAFRERVAAAWAALLRSGDPATIVVAHAGSLAMALSLAPPAEGDAPVGRIEPGEILEVEVGIEAAPRVIGRWRPEPAVAR